MSDTTRTSTSPPTGGVLNRLLERGWEFDFFQAVWLLEKHCGGRTPVGQRGPVAAEMRRVEPPSIAEFVEIWYSKSTREQLEKIQIRR